jgi:diguanylate cyclase (GGDEF)-like protein
MRLQPNSGEVAVFDVQDGLPDAGVLSLLCDRAGDLWIGMERGGVTCMRATSATTSEFAVLPIDEGLTDYMTLSILQDRNGSYWFGSLAGLTLFEPEGSYRAKTWATFTRADGLAHNLITAVHHDAQRRFWFGSYGGGVTALANADGIRQWETFDESAGLSNDVVRAIAEDSSGLIWFGTFGGLSRFDPASRQWRTFRVTDGLAGDAVRTIKAARDGAFWVGTDGGGISVFDPLAEQPSFRNYTTFDGLPSNRVGSILHDSRGRVWAGTYEGGAAILEDGQWRSISKEDGLPANDVYCIAEDPAGRFWIGTGGSGMARLDGDVWRVFTERDGLPNDTVYQVLIESEHSIYASTNRGVFRLRFDAGREVIVGFDRTDGLADDECNGGASLRDRDGRFWIGTLSGVSFIDPRDVPERIPPCAVYVNGFFVHDEPMDLERCNTIEDSKHEFALTYGAVEYVSSQKVRYRTWLEGFDDDWSKVTAERAIRYTNLLPRQYRFKVQARNWGGEWSDAAELAFEVVPDRERLAREEQQERERIDRKVLETAHTKLQQLAAELRNANEKLQEKEIQLEMQAREDALTGVLNRRYLDIQLQREFDRAVRFERPLSVVMADLDHFKSINDRFSHAVGDAVLRTAARLIRTSVRSVDVVARYGGEEFALLLPETPLHLARLVCEKIRHALASYPWHEVHPDLQLTASFGCADDTSNGPLQMLHAADQMLFEAKRQGRNRVAG